MAVAAVIAATAAFGLRRFPVPHMPSGNVTMGRCVTSLNPSQTGRNGNIALAASILNGHEVHPGEEFSFNAVLGERSAESGYGLARVIIDGRSEAGLAGGICQVSSALYNAALNCGMVVTERHPHSRPVPYLPPGFDATVSYPELDLKWINPTDRTVKLCALVEGNELIVGIEGWDAAPRIELVSEIVEVIAPRPAGVPNPTGRPTAGAPAVQAELVNRGEPGYRVRVWAESRLQDGSYERRLVSEDLYEPVSAVVR